MSLTTANSVVTLTVANLFNTPQQIEGYAVDDAFTTAALKAGEALMGVDGLLSGGFVLVPVEQEYHLMADSPSISFFDQWYAGNVQIKDAYTATGSILLPSLGIKFAMTKGFLVNYPIIPNAKKLLQARTFGITWQSAVPQPA